LAAGLCPHPLGDERQVERKGTTGSKDKTEIKGKRGRRLGIKE